MNRQKAIKKIIRKLNRVIGLHLASVKLGRCEQARREQRELVNLILVNLIRETVETDWKP